MTCQPSKSPRIILPDSDLEKCPNSDELTAGNCVSSRQENGSSSAGESTVVIPRFRANQTVVERWEILQPVSLNRAGPARIHGKKFTVKKNCNKICYLL
jgi:hypothetical protein